MRTIPSAALLGFALAAISMPAGADVDSPGRLVFDFMAEEQNVCSSFDDVSNDELHRDVPARAFFSTDASSFGEGGVLIWASFDFEADRRSVDIAGTDSDIAEC